MHGTPRHSLIDIDEFGLHKNAANRKRGSSLKGLYIRKPGHKLTIILAIEAGNPALDGQNPPSIGSTEYPHIWAEVSEEAGTTAEAYTAFLVQKPLATYNAAIEQKTIIHDNLTSHKSPMVYEAIRRSGHRVAPRPPYRPIKMDLLNTLSTKYYNMFLGDGQSYLKILPPEKCVF